MRNPGMYMHVDYNYLAFLNFNTTFGSGLFLHAVSQQLFDSYSHKRLPLYRLKGPIINKACTSIIHRPLIHRPEAKRGYSVILTMDPFSDNK